MPNDVLTRNGLQDRPNRFDLPPKPPADNTGSVYDMRPYRPMWQLVVRGALWAALAVGCIGGIVALLGVGKDPAEQVVYDDSGSDAAILAVPAPVAGTAERAVGAWLEATTEDKQLLDEMFIEPATLAPKRDTDGVAVTGLSTVTGHMIQDGYWVVTVQADVIETFDNQAQPDASWYIEVGIVGNVETGLQALSTPSIMPGPKTGLSGWATSRPPMRQPETGDLVAQTVEGFLDALLAEKGDPSQYLAPGVVIPAASPVPFTDVTVSAIATEDNDDGSTHVWVDVLATTQGGREQPGSYELIVTPREGGSEDEEERWEIQTLWGAPSLDEAPVEGD
jgi:hypothetical protein